MYTRNAPDGLWTTAPGIAATPPARRDSTVRRPLDLWPDGRYTIFGEVAVRGAPWFVVLETPLATVHARARETVVRIALLSLFLTALGALVSWTISRRVTRPLRELTTAAEGIARGDYSRQVVPAGADELVRLATSFNEMAREVDASHQELEQQVEEAQSAAEALEIANLHLQESTVAAEDAREEAVRARAEAERANQAKSDFLAVMSHELRTPLNAIAGYTQILAMGVHGPVNDAQRDALERIARSETHLLRLITDVLNFAKIDAGQMEYAIADVPLDEALAEVETLVAPQLQAKGLGYTYERCDPMLTVRADREKLLQVVLNLLSNAIKFTARGGSVRVSCATTDRGVRIIVRDTGCGIPAKRMASIFEPFVQGDRALHRPHEGIGLGLAISRDLARGMGGDILAESAEGEGSTFTVALARGTSGAPAGPPTRRGDFDHGASARSTTPA
jgi:signal transduction histidine kinase